MRLLIGVKPAEWRREPAQIGCVAPSGAGWATAALRFGCPAFQLADWAGGSSPRRADIANPTMAMLASKATTTILR